MLWDIRIHDAQGKLVCVSRLTVAVLKQRDDLPHHKPLPGMAEA